MSPPTETRDAEAGAASPAGVKPELSNRSLSMLRPWRLNSISREVRLFGAFTLLSTLIIIGMSIYVVHNTEFRFDEEDDKLLASSGRTMITAAEEHEIPTLAALVKLSAEELRKVNDVSVLVSLPNGAFAQVMMKVDRVVRQSTGLTRICAPDGACILAFPRDGAWQANYTDVDECSLALTEGSGCPLILSEDEAALLAERRGRQLHWNWNPFHSHASGSDSGSPSASCKSHNEAPSIFCRTAVMNDCGCEFDDDHNWLGCATDYHYCSSWNPFCFAICGQHDRVRYKGWCGVSLAEGDCSTETPG